jgi:hypothetical protein
MMMISDTALVLFKDRMVQTNCLAGSAGCRFLKSAVGKAETSFS